jgi:hypothetical protein
MTISDQLVFLSYSRKDYYFAESLAFHLLSRNIPVWLDVKDLKPGVDWERDLEAALAAASCVVLIGSPGAFKSVNVRSEWQRAGRLGKRIIVARRRGVRLPDELKGREIVDFRGAFGRALDQLVATLTVEPPDVNATYASARVSFVPRLPPGVATIAAALAIPLLGYFALVTGAGDSEAGNYSLPVYIALSIIAIFLLLWFFLLGFLERRMGITRLAVCLGCLAAVFAYPLFRLFYWGPLSLSGYDAGIIRLIVDHWPTGALLGAIPLLGLAILLLARPEDLLRWSPTGKVWDRYRIGRVSQGSAEIVDAAAAFKLVKSFRLFYDVPDAPAAGRLRQELISAGSREARPGDAEATVVLLLTNRTHTLWLHQQAEHAKGALLTVVASAISLPDTLGWLWKREWVDFRGWDINQSVSTRGLPRVPEAVTNLRFPTPVTRTHHLLCAFGALLLAVDGAVQPADSARTETLSVPQIVGAVSAVIGLLYVIPARRLIRRRLSMAQFSQWTGPIAAFASVSGLITLFGYCVINPDSWIRAVPAMVFLLITPVLFRRLRPAIEFWLPIADAAAEKQKPDCLAPGRNWRTLAWFVAYLFVWVVLLRDINQ